MLEQRIQQHFFDSADLHYQAAEGMARPIALAVAALEACLTSGGRVLVAGAGHAHGLAPLLVQLLVHRFERERPGLGALLLGGSSALALGDAGDAPALLVRELETLSQPADLLLLIDPLGTTPAMLAAASAAQAQGMSVVALTAAGSALAAVLGDTDVMVAVPHQRLARVLEVQLLVLHCLCDAIDLQLLGQQDMT